MAQASKLAGRSETAMSQKGSDGRKGSSLRKRKPGGYVEKEKEGQARTRDEGSDENSESHSSTHSGKSDERKESKSRYNQADDLPDLTSKLIKAGIYEEYCVYRDNYTKWRQGGYRGAKGEVSDVVKQADQKDQHKLELWFPTPQKYHFFFTVSYWGAIFALEGSFMFTFSAALPYFLEGPKVTLLMHWCNFIGASIFFLGVYCVYLELINLQDVERVYLFPSWEHWLKLLQRVRWESFMGTMSYVVASFLFQIMVTLCILPGLGSKLGLPERAVPLLSFVGGFGFLIGGICEVLHTWWDEHGAALHSLVAWLNCIGGLCFFLSGAAELFAHDYTAFINFNVLAGSVLYTVGAVCLLVMWQGNDFGGSLLEQLNHNMCAGDIVKITSEGQEGLRVRVNKLKKSLSIGGLVRGVSETLSDRFGMGDAPKTKLSLRGVISLCIYCWLFICTTANFVLGIVLLRSGERSVSEAAMTLFLMLAVKVILVVHSAITAVPNEQPYRFAMQSMWCLLVFATAVQTASLFSSVPLVAGTPVGHALAGAHAAAGPSPQSSHGGEL